MEEMAARAITVVAEAAKALATEAMVTEAMAPCVSNALKTPNKDSEDKEPLFHRDGPLRFQSAGMQRVSLPSVIRERGETHWIEPIAPDRELLHDIHRMDR